MPHLVSLLSEVKDARIVGDRGVVVTAVAADSRRVEPGCVFIAVPGARHDGAAFVADALDRGASAVVSSEPMEVPNSVTLVRVDDPMSALAAIASAFYGHPERTLRLIGVTGTDGKTSVAYLTAGMLTACGIPCGYLGTLGAEFAGAIRATHHTTPPQPDLSGLLGWMKDQGAKAVALEASSHSLDQGRLRGLTLGAGVFTSFGRDHLDYHRTPEAYLEAKLRLFDLVLPEAPRVVNADYPAVVDRVRQRGGRVITFSGGGACADVSVIRSRMDLKGTEVEICHGKHRGVVASPLLGLFQVENLTAAATAGVSLGIPLHEVVRGLASVRRIPGRFEAVSAGDTVWAVVDYAHTPGALERALRSARTVTRGRIVVVFGCGGDRDRGKRPLMGSIASRLADTVILTSDNPRSEDPDAIIREIAQGVDGPATLKVEPDRRSALALAASLATYGDLVLVAGKGHETTQTIGDMVIQFNDVEELSVLSPAGASTKRRR